jgi:hypothetical protein
MQAPDPSGSCSIRPPLYDGPIPRSIPVYRASVPVRIR